MMRSFSYAALTGLNVATHTRPEDAERLAPWAQLWEREVVATFLRAYRAATEGTALSPRDADDFDTLLRAFVVRSEEHTSELQSQSNLVCRLLLEKKKNK